MTDLECAISLIQANIEKITDLHEMIDLVLDENQNSNCGEGDHLMTEDQYNTLRTIEQSLALVQSQFKNLKRLT